jgi:hypothetical protein
MRIQLKLTFQNKDNGAHVFTNIRIFGKKYIALIDTGATSTAFDVDFVKDNIGGQHLELMDDPAGGLGTTDMMMYATELEFRMGQKQIRQTVALIDYTHIHKLYEMHGLKKFHFIIGNDILLELDAIINYKKKTLSIETNRRKPKNRKHGKQA